MNQEAHSGASPVTEHVDVLIVGAGISGVAAAYHLMEKCPDLRFLILEAEDHFGGTWWTHTFPGIRSDSDLHTFGFSFKPWVGPPIATAPEILKYMGEVIDENDIARHIRYGHKVIDADWNPSQSRWHIGARDMAADESVHISANFLFMCQGYYRHREGFMPEWEGVEDFQGELVHCENWPEDTVVDGKRVVVIGSGATAATVVPAIAGRAKHVTMLQRSPTYFRAGRNAIELAEELRQLEVDETWIHEITRRKLLKEQANFTKLCFDHPDRVKQELVGAIRDILPEGYDVDTHFTPSYAPWTQRLAFVPDADLFEAVKRGDASVVTGHIDRFVADGIRLTNGEVVQADLVAAATGFNMNVMGDIAFSKDGEPIDFHDTITYRGTMFTDVPNMAWVFGYFRASWTLRSELIAEFVCRLLNHLRDNGYVSVAPTLRAEQQQLTPRDWIDDSDFNPQYLQRAVSVLPRRLDVPEWQHTQDYWNEKDIFPEIDLNDAVFCYRDDEGAQSQTTPAAASGKITA